jgi:drug/metabolite transporter (DMT)-like permease
MLLAGQIAALLAVGAMWGLTPAMAKVAMEHGMRPLGVATLAAGIAAIVLVAVAAARGQRPPMDWAHVKQYAGGGVVGLALAQLFAFTGLTRAPAGLFALLVPLSALLTVLFFALAGVERATRRGLVGAAIGMAGVALAMAPGAALPDPALLPWAAVMLLTPVCYALANLLSVKWAVGGTPVLAQAAGTVVFATIGAAVLAQGVLTALAYLLYFRLLVQAGGVFTSQTSYVITLAGMGWGFLLFAEVPGWLTIPAAALIFCGVALVTLEKRAPPTRRGA